MKDSKIMLGMLPSLRFKKDAAAVKNSVVTPNLGVGLAYSYKMFAAQIPLYCNPKTATKNGRWVAGFGIGLRISEIKKK